MYFGIVTAHTEQMNLPGSDGDGPYGAVFIVMCFADGSRQASDADAVAAHQGIVGGAVGIHVLHVHGLAVFGSQLEDIPHLNAAGYGQGVPAAYRTDARCV